jgi:hypothetical protein
MTVIARARYSPAGVEVVGRVSVAVQHQAAFLAAEDPLGEFKATVIPDEPTGIERLLKQPRLGRPDPKSIGVASLHTPSMDVRYDNNPEVQCEGLE